MTCTNKLSSALRRPQIKLRKYWGKQEGLPIEIGDFRKKLARLRQQELEQLISTAHDKFMPYVRLGDLSEADVEEAVALLKRDEARLTPRNRKYRDDIIRCLKREISVLEVFGAGHIIRPEPVPTPQPPPPASKSRGDQLRAEGRIKLDAAICHGAPDGWFRPGAGKLEWFKDHGLVPR